MDDKIIEIIAKISKKDILDIKSNMNQEKLWDSLNHVELIVALEAEFSIFFAQEEIAVMTTPLKVIEFVEKKFGEI